MFKFFFMVTLSDMLGACNSAAPTVAPTATVLPVSPVAPTSAQTPACPVAGSTPADEEVMALVHGTLVDGTGAAPIRDAVVVIRHGRIVAVGERARVAIPSDAKTIDVQGTTILPGFINAHVHQGYSEQNLKAWAQGGVTTVRDLGAFSSDDPFARRDVLLKDSLNARLVIHNGIVIRE